MRLFSIGIKFDQGVPYSVPREREILNGKPVWLKNARAKTKKKQKQELVQKEKKAESKNVQKLVQRLDELRKKEKYVDVAVCPRCKSVARALRRVKSTMGDTTGHLGWLPVIYECLYCGWRGRLEIFATNKKQSWKEVAVMAEARDIDEEED